MIAINETANEDTAIIAWNLSTSTSFKVGGAPWPSPPSIEISGERMAIYDGSGMIGSKSILFWGDFSRSQTTRIVSTILE